MTAKYGAPQCPNCKTNIAVTKTFTPLEHKDNDNGSKPKGIVEYYCRQCSKFFGKKII